MKLYADRPLRATHQLLGDLLLLVWSVCWIWLAFQVHEKVAALAAPGRQAESAGNKLAGSLRGAGRSIDDLPVVGDQLRRPFDEGADSGRNLAAAARSYQESVADLARFTAIAVAVIPILLALAWWLPRRLSWVRAATSARRLLRSGAGERALDLFALRALVRQPLTSLDRLGGDPAQGWRHQDPGMLEDLAELELADLGLRLPGG